jgi:hypothetical protein
MCNVPFAPGHWRVKRAPLWLKYNDSEVTDGRTNSADEHLRAAGIHSGDYSMPRNRTDFDTVRRIAFGLPNVEESTIHRSPALKVHGKLLACIAVHRSAEPNSLAVRIDFDRRAELMATAPEVYYLTDHYVNYPVVLVRLSRIRTDDLRDLLSMAWRFVTARAPGGKSTIRKQKHLSL